MHIFLMRVAESYLENFSMKRALTIEQSNMIHIDGEWREILGERKRGRGKTVRERVAIEGQEE